MRTFEQFPESSICKICGTNTNKECILVPIDGTNKDGNSQAISVHVDCIGKLRYNQESNVFYILGVKE